MKSKLNRYTKRIKIYIFWQITLGFLCTLCLALVPIVKKDLVDNIANKDFSYVVGMIFIYAGLLLINIVLEYLDLIVTWKGAIKFEKILKKDFFKAVFSMRKEDFYKNKIGDYISLQANDITSLEQDWLQPVIDLVKSFVMFVVYGFIIFRFVDKRIAFLILITSVFAAYTPKLFSKYLAEKRKVYQDGLATYTSKISDLLSGFNVINADTYSAFNKKHFQTLNETSDKRYAFGKAKSISLSFGQLVLKLIEIISFSYSAILLYRGEISLGTMVASLAYIGAFIDPLDSIVYDINTIASVKSVEKNFMNYIEADNKIDLKSKSKKLINYDLKLEDVNYHNDKIRIKDLNVTFKAGQSYAIVGHNGSGKSTLLKLIVGHLGIEDGRIYIDGEDEENYLGHIAYLCQDEHIFASDFEDNLTVFGSYNLDLKDFEKSDIYKKISDEKDLSCLSGGEKQFVGFLRLLVQNKDILILDEPFSAMNPALKEELTKYLFTGNRTKGKTIIMVTHDLSSENLKLFDCVYEMEEGSFKTY